jgi:hypothetical protein
MARYEQDVIAWSEEQAALLRSRRFDELDIERIIWLIEDQGQAQVGHFHHALSLALRHVLTWKYSPQERSRKLRSLIVARRRAVFDLLGKTPSLSKWLINANFWNEIWEGELVNRLVAPKELRYAQPKWTPTTVIDEAFFPD